MITRINGLNLEAVGVWNWKSTRPEIVTNKIITVDIPSKAPLST